MSHPSKPRFSRAGRRRGPVRAAAVVITSALTVAGPALPASAQEVGDTGTVPASRDASVASTSLDTSVDLAQTGSASNANAPVLAQLSSGFSPLSASPGAGPNGSLVTPTMMGVTTIMSLIPVGSLAAGVQLLSLVGQEQLVNQAVGSLTGRGPASPQPDATITTSEVRTKTPTQDPNVPGQLEVWTVTSAAMQREVQVEVLLPGGDQPAPVLYLLDGVDTLVPSSFRAGTDVPRRAHDEGFGAVIPTGATGSNFTDWIADDPVLGRNKWETFLTKELPPLVEQDARMRFNGKRGIAGLSMGAGAALQVAASAPEMYAAAAGISGCYTTTSDLGYETLRLSVETRGGTLANMWGPRGDALWQRHNLPDHADRFRNMKVFLSAATGAIGPDDAAAYGANPGLLFAGYALESGVWECTKEFSHALDRAGVDHTELWLPTGVHNFTSFLPGIRSGLDTILPALR